MPAKQKKYKKLTRAEKALNKEIKQEMISKGILPPPKPKLNRKKFAKETIGDYRENLNTWDDVRFLYEAISWMLPSTEGRTQVNLEEVGVLKVLKIALAIKEFHRQKRENGETQYKPYDLYKDIIVPIKNL